MSQEENFEILATKLADLLLQSGDFIETLGKTEAEDPEYFSFIEEMKNNPQGMKQFLEKIPKKYATEVLGLFFRLSIVASNFKEKPFSPKLKMETGNELKSIGGDLKKLIKDNTGIEVKK